ncbi:glycosyl transferase [Rhodosalinus halophilus]|uniref:Peptide O-xylosyltransferase n=1 Tax=Rhodosalinus halophilus TaxID=2259333 RepID=A0A365U8J9_9RHOB|nr:DUF5928 domain-containing protein [Rhodosalinus halophilus]RBI84794.1 glycosyl transferase [Rhodosalinus halophilus]
MARIAFILLCHKDPEAVIKQAQRLTTAGDYMAIHLDARADPAHYRRIRSELDPNPNVTFVRRRVKCGWGEWSLVSATLEAVRAAVAAFPEATHFYLLSGDCMAIKSAEYAHAFLDAQDRDYIESFDFFASDWIKTGLREERLIYRHFFNERRRKAWFYASLEWQKRLGLEREIPRDLQVMIGSQWWCLRRRTIEMILDFIAERPDVVRFFRTTWIPDETFFQTLVRHLVPETEIENRTLTFLLFSDYGMPVVFYNDHYDLLLSQDALFARKVSPEAQDLKRRLGLLYASQGTQFQISNEGASLYHFLTERGRIGRRFAPRFWETESSLGRERELLIVVCKKWHVAKRLLERIRQMTNIPCVEYLFNEKATELPDLGGIEATMGKRHRHRRALLRMLFEHFGADRMVICLDPANLDLLQDFCGDRSVTRLLEIECQFTDEYLIGHAMRVGLAGARTPPETLARLLPTIRNEMALESDRIRDAGFANHLRLREIDSPEANAAPLAEFLGLGPDKALEIAQTDHLFAD